MQMSTYLFNGAVCGFDSVYQSTRIQQVWTPSCFLFWEPGAPTTADQDTYNDGGTYPYYPDYPEQGLGLNHHSIGGNVARLDGAVVFMTLTNFNADVLTLPGRGPGPGGKTFFWWSVFSSNGH